MKPWILFAAYACLTLSLCAQEVEAGLYRPAASSLVMRYAPANVDETTPLAPLLHLYGRGFPAGRGTLEYAVLCGDQALHRGKVEIETQGRIFERSVELPQPFASADGVGYTVRIMGSGEWWSGRAPLRWSKFSGRLEYVDGRMRPSYISLSPYTFKDCRFLIPVGEDGSFAAQVPARVYAVANVNGAGYAYDAMERWAWDFDLSRDRQETFAVGRSELYGMRAFCLLGPTSTVFVVFRASALTRILQHAPLRDARPKDEATMAAITEHLKENPLAVAPELARERVKVRLDGEEFPPSDLSRIVETSATGLNQALYILQFTPPRRPQRGVRHEIVVEVESRDVLHGELIRDFGQGSVGLYLE